MRATDLAKPVILLVEDDEELLRLNQRKLARRGYEVCTAATATAADAAFDGRPPDLVVLDVMLPDGDGYELCVRFRSRSDAPVLFLTGKDSTESKVTGLGVGGDYYLTKPYLFEEFLAVVEMLLRRERLARERQRALTLLVKGPLTLEIPKGRALIDGRDVNLSHKEFLILLTLVQNEGKSISGEQLYEAAWEKGATDNSQALRSHVSRLRKKLDMDNTDAFDIVVTYGKGYCFINNA